MYGADAQVRATDRVEVGAGLVRDTNPMGRFDLASVNATIAVGSSTWLLGEFARTDNEGSGTGSASRIELRHSAARTQARLYFLDSDRAFLNPSAAFGSGRTELGGRGFLRLGERLGLYAEALQTEDKSTDGRRRGVSVGLERGVGSWMQARLGYRYADETAAPSSSASESTPNSTHALSSRLTAALPFAPASLFAEFEQDVAETTQRRASMGGGPTALRADAPLWPARVPDLLVGALRIEPRREAAQHRVRRVG